MNHMAEQRFDETDTTLEQMQMVTLRCLLTQNCMLYAHLLYCTFVNTVVTIMDHSGLFWGKTL